MAETKLPASLESVFWDCEFGEVSLEKHLGFVIRRVLERGDSEAIAWLRRAAGD